MGFTLAAYDEASLTSTLQNVAAVSPDTHLTVSGDDIYVPEYNKLLGVMGIGNTMFRARLETPSLRANYELDVIPVNAATEPSSPPAWLDMFDSPIDLEVNEAMNFLTQGDGGATRYLGLVWLGQGMPTKASGRCIPTRATSTTTLGANAWTACALTFQKTLPAGRYACLGARFHSAGAIAGRLIFPGHPWRPGSMAFDTNADLAPDRFRFGRAGVWGEFTNRSPPQAEFLSISADTAEEIVLDLVYLGK